MPVPGNKYILPRILGDSHLCFQNCPFFAPLDRSELYEVRGEYYQYLDEENAMFRAHGRGR